MYRHKYKVPAQNTLLFCVTHKIVPPKYKVRYSMQRRLYGGFHKIHHTESVVYRLSFESRQLYLHTAYCTIVFAQMLEDGTAAEVESLGSTTEGPAARELR
jgi:hypothetical protein